MEGPLQEPKPSKEPIKILVGTAVITVFMGSFPPFATCWAARHELVTWSFPVQEPLVDLLPRATARFSAARRPSQSSSGHMESAEFATSAFPFPPHLDDEPRPSDIELLVDGGRDPVGEPTG